MKSVQQQTDFQYFIWYAVLNYLCLVKLKYIKLSSKPHTDLLSSFYCHYALKVEEQSWDFFWIWRNEFPKSWVFPRHFFANNHTWVDKYLYWFKNKVILYFILPVLQFNVKKKAVIPRTIMGFRKWFIWVHIIKNRESTKIVKNFLIVHCWIWSCKEHKFLKFKLEI